MINKLISKSQVAVLEHNLQGNPNDEYKQGYIRAIQDVLDLEPIPTLGVDELYKIRAELWDNGLNMGGEYQGCWVRYRDIEKIFNKPHHEYPHGAGPEKRRSGPAQRGLQAQI